MVLLTTGSVAWTEPIPTPAMNLAMVQCHQTVETDSTMTACAFTDNVSDEVKISYDERRCVPAREGIGIRRWRLFDRTSR